MRGSDIQKHEPWQLLYEAALAIEDAIISQIREEIKKVSLSSAWANASISQFEKEKLETAQAERAIIGSN